MTDHAEAAHAAIRRLSGLPADRIEVTLVEGPERFDVTSVEGRLRVVAGTPVAAVAGYAQFARRTGAGSVSRSGVRPLDVVPDGARHTGRAVVPHRVAYNLTVGGYTTPFFSWSEWERELDLLAASSVTDAHVTVGQEVVWLEAFGRFGYGEDELLAWIVPPSHQPWQWLNNVQGFGGGTSRALVESRVELGRRVLARMAELGIRPVLPGFSGSVPPGLADRLPGARIVSQGKWFMDVAGPERPDWLMSSTPEYAEVAAAFYAAQERLFGVGGTWAVDLLHEGGKIGDTTLAAAAVGVQEAMRAADPAYTWVLQAWAGNPRAELLEVIDREHLLILDLTGEDWERKDAFGGVPWAWGILPNYGGRTGLYGDLRAIAAAPGILAGGPGTGKVVGTTDMAEGVANNPVVWDLLHDLTWAEAPIDLDAWTTEWVASRYGRADDDAVRAWAILRENAYGPWRVAGTAPMPAETLAAMTGQAVDLDALGAPASDSPFGAMTEGAGSGDFEDFQFYAGTDSIVGAIPSLDANQASTVGPRRLPYAPDALVPALDALTAAAGRLERTPSLDYDLVDVARQVLVDTARLQLPRVKAAYGAGDVAGFDAASSAFLDLVDSLDEVLAAHPAFRLDTWVDQARALTDDPAEQDRVVEWGLRLLTVWGGRDESALAEYATRDWAGLVGGYHRGRWARWFAELRRHLRGEPTSPVDWYAYAEEWLASGTWAAGPAAGDPLAAARGALELARRIG